MALFVLSLCPFDISVGVGAFVIGLSQISSFFSCNPKVAGSSLPWTTIFLPTMFACLYTSVQVKTRTQNEWSVTNQIGYTDSDKILIFSIFVGCFYHKGPALRALYIFLYDTTPRCWQVCLGLIQRWTNDILYIKLSVPLNRI